MNDRNNHLVIIQGVINRMGGNSFLLKGWAVTLVGGILAIAGSAGNGKLALLAFFPLIIFWGLDGYYLWHERLFRALYKDVAEGKKSVKSFSLNIDSYKDDKKWLQSVLSLTVAPLYVASGAVIVLVVFIARFIHG